MPSYVRSGTALAVGSLKSATQMHSQIKALADGGFMVVWQSSDPNADGSGYAIRAQRYDSQGVAVGGETLINNSTAGDQNWPQIAILASGGYVVTWDTSDTTQDGSGFAIKARLFDASGTPLGVEFRVNTQAVADQKQPNVVALSDGGFVIAWQTTDTAQDGSGGAVKGQRFDSAGVPVGGEFLINSLAAGSQTNVDLAAVANGGFVATWSSGNGGVGTQVKGQVFAADGARIGSEFFASDGTGTHTSGRVTALQAGGFILTWSSGGASRAQFFDSAGGKVGSQFTIGGSDVEVAVRADGTLLMTWWDTFGSIKAQVYSTAGQILGPQTTVFQASSAAGLASFQSVALLANGNVALSWDHSNLAGDLDIRAQILRPNTGLDLGAATRTASVAENGFWQLEVLAQVAPLDSPGMPITYSIVGGADAARFTLTATGELRFNSSSNYEAPTDSNGDNVYEVIVRASDGEFSDEQTISVAVTNLNEAPNITSHPFALNTALTVAENQSVVTTFTATDPDGPTTLTYSIISGVDRARFTINASTGVLSFISAPNFEVRADADGNNVYQVTIAVSDGQKSDSRVLSITVADVNEAPVISGSQTNYFHNENDTAIGTLSASDPEGAAVTWSIAGGADAARFAIDPVTGALRFVTAPNYEAPADVGANNIYNVIVSASDGSVTTTRALTVEVLNRGEGPVITSGGGGDSASYGVAENTGFVTTILADDPDTFDNSFSFWIVGGADAALFFITGDGQLSFKNGLGANFEAPTDADGNNVYEVIVSARSGLDEPADTQALSITVTDANDAPVITSNGGGATASLSLAENQLAVTTVIATDADNAPLSYGILSGADAALFTINAQTGALSFITAPNWEAPSDAGANNVYNVTVAVSDGQKLDYQPLTITILNSNEAPVISSNGGGSAAAITIVENGLAVTNVAAADPEGTALSYAISGGADASHFLIDSATGALSFLMSPDHEQPADSDGDNVYDVTVSASDGVSSDTQALSITVANANERPVIVSNGGGTSAFVEVDEGQTAVTTVAADDPEGTGSVTYSITGGFHADLFTIDSATGALSFAAAPDYEAPLGESSNFYSVTVTASDGELSSFQSVQVGVRNVNEGVIITSGAAATVGENGTAVMTVTAQDLDGDSVSFAISGGADAALFAVDPQTGALRFLAAPNFEAPADANGDNVYDVVVSASDGSLTSTQALAVSVSNVNEGVTIAGSQTDYLLAENGSAVAGFIATDADGDAVTWSIAGGADAARFAIDAATGALRFVATPDFEVPGDADSDNFYNVTISASDGSLSATRSLTVQISDRNEGPVIVSGGGGDSASLSTAENLGLVTTIVADDPDAVDLPYSFSIVGGADAGLFVINAQTGQLYMTVAARNFEAPADSDGDNVYDVIVAVGDGSEAADTQALSVTVTDSNETPVITSNGGSNSVGLISDEGISHVTTVVAYDPDGTTPAYSITGGNDAALFTIDPTTGVLRFVNEPDYENRLDAHDSSIYEVIVTASDGELSSWQFISVWVRNVNEAVTITSGGGADSVAVTVDEDQAVVANVDAVDADGTPILYSIAGGADAAFFGIDPLTGELFIAGADYDLPGDADGDNVYEVIVAADDGWLSDTQAFSVTVADVDEPLAFTSYNSDFYVTLEADENSLDAAVAAAEDPEGRAIVYSLVDGYDGASFTIDAETGVIRFAAAPDHELPADSGGDNVYTILVAATDGTFFDYQTISIHVRDLEERPVITTGPAVSVNEDHVYVQVNATDSDGDPLTYSIVGGADSAHFMINPETGDLTPLTFIDYEAPVDADGDNVYEVIVRASDGQLSDDRQLSITVNDVYDDVEIVSYGGADLVSLTVEEGTGYQIIDVDASISTFWGTRFAITGGADAALFEINQYTGLVSFAYPFRTDFEAPGDADGDNVYDLVVTASTATSSDSQTFAIAIADVNEHLSITSHGWGDTVVLNEGAQVVTTIVAVDKDGDVPVYSIAGGADAALFAIDAATGVLTFIAPPDFEAPGSAAGTNLYSVEVAASDGEFTHELPIHVQIGNVNERPVITSGGGGDTVAVTANENGVAATSIAASDVDGNTLTWSITGGADASLFTIESWSGILRFIQGPNFEAPGDVGGNNVYDVVVSVTDGLLTDSQAVAVTVANVNEAVAITSNGGAAAAAVSVAENGTAVTLVAASDPDGGAVTYAIAGGADAARFTIDSGTGALSFVSAPNFEAPADAGGNNVYDVVVSATDGSSTDTQALTVSVGNVNEGVVITSNGGGSSAAVAVAENGTAVANVSASDADGGAVTYAIAGGADSSRFTINAATGALAFIAAPNFEAPGDVGGNNVYDVIVSASDGLFSDTQAIAVQVGNVNEAPAVTSNGGGATAAISVAENSLAVTTVSAGDPDGTAATYSIVGGADAARFTINPQTGLLQFVAAPDHELPADSNGDNVYAVVVRASDGQLSDDQALSVTVTNVRDGNNVTGTSGGDSISATSTNVALRTSNEEDTVFGRDGHDNIQGMAGDDDLYGEAGNDVLIGGAGADRLTGGLGKDTYTYNNVSESSVMARDSIMDFSRAQGDKISLSAIDSNSLVGNNQAFTFIGTAAFSNVAGQLRYETWGGVTTISGDVNGDAVADLVIQLSGSIALISSDFIL